MGRGRWIAFWCLGTALCVTGAGCFTGGVAHIPRGESLSDDLSEPSLPALTRFQQADSPEMKGKQTPPPLLPTPIAETQPAPSKLPPVVEFPPIPNPSPPTPLPEGEGRSGGTPSPPTPLPEGEGRTGPPKGDAKPDDLPPIQIPPLNPPSKNEPAPKNEPGDPPIQIPPLNPPSKSEPAPKTEPDDPLPIQIPPLNPPSKDEPAPKTGPGDPPPIQNPPKSDPAPKKLPDDPPLQIPPIDPPLKTGPKVDGGPKVDPGLKPPLEVPPPVGPGVNPDTKGPPPKLPPPPGIPPLKDEILQTSLKGLQNRRVTVRAWVNGRPIFDGEVMQILQSTRSWFDLQRLAEPLRSEKLRDAHKNALDTVIEQELMYQDAVKKLEKNNPRALEKLKQASAAEFDKDLKRIRDTGQVPEDELKEFENSMRKHMQRSFVSMEYVRSRIYPYMNSRIGPKEIEDYYKNHPEEFQRADAVEWQDVFIAVSPKLPTVAEAKHFAEDLIARCRTVEDFNALSQFDDGDSKYRNGRGMGTRRNVLPDGKPNQSGDAIKPAEVEDVLFKLKEGQIGPVVALTTGVHIIRLLKREQAGQIPLDEATQNQIRNKLRGQLVDREYRRIVRELRERSVIEIIAEH